MPVFRLDEELWLPRPELAEPSGLLAVGGDLRAERLLLAYAHGIFPWYADGLPILWHSPDPRCVLHLDELHVPRSLGKTLRRGLFEVRLDTAFDAVVAACAQTPRPSQHGTWITTEMRAAYGELHRRGFAHSAEAWRDGELAGGLYGVSLGGVYFGESMFTRADDAAKVAFVVLAAQLRAWGIDLIDCQTTTPHLVRFGARPVPRAEFLATLAAALRAPTRRGKWALGAGAA